MDTQTGYKSPSANSVIVAGWSNPANTYAEDSSFSDTTTPLAEMALFDFNFPTIPPSAKITNIVVKLLGYADAGAGFGAPIISASWDGGVTYGASYRAVQLTTPATVNPLTNLGVDTIFDRDWSPAEFTNANFRLAVKAQSPPRHMYIDHVQVNIQYEFGNKPVILVN